MYTKFKHLFIIAVFATILVSCDADSKSQTASENTTPQSPPGKNTSKSPKPMGPPPVKVETRPVQVRRFILTLSVPGALKPLRESQIAAAVSGMVKKIAFNEGDVVAKGQVLVAIEDEVLQGNLLEKQAEIDRAQAELDRLQNGYRPEEIEEREASVQEIEVQLQNLAIELKRRRNLYLSNNLSQTEFDQTRYAHKAMMARLARVKAELALRKRGFREEIIRIAKANLAKARAQLIEVRDALAKTRVKAPFAGIIAQKGVELGEWVGEDTTVAEIVDTTKVKVEVPIPERYIALVRKGLKAQVLIDALPDKKMVARVIEILPRVYEGSRSFPVRLLLNNPQGVLKAGMFCRVAGIFKDDPNALMIHSDALVRQGNKISTIKVIANRQVQFVPLVVGQRDGNWFEVLDAKGQLANGDKVVVTNNRSVFPGAQVIVAREYPAQAE